MKKILLYFTSDMKFWQFYAFEGYLNKIDLWNLGVY